MNPTSQHKIGEYVHVSMICNVDIIHAIRYTENII